MRNRIGFIVALLALSGLMMSCGKGDRGRGTVAAEAWYAGAPLYEVYIRSATPEGTFEAFRRDLQRIEDLGVRNLWLMPIFPTGVEGRKGSAGSPYSVRDYFAVNPEFGTEEEFRALVDEAHRRGMRVILDMVINHASNDNVEMERHPGWFLRDSTGAFSREVADWSDVTDWRNEDPEVADYLARVLLYWVREFGVDGYRCDVAGMVPDAFWLSAIPRLKEARPDLFMLAEWQDPKMIADGFDADYDWDLYHRMVEYRKGETLLGKVWSTVRRRRESYPPGALALRFIENHDQQRAAEVFGVPGYRPYAALIFTLPGIPLLYVGQEIGATHRPSLFEKEPVDWSAADSSVYRTYTGLIRLRAAHPALRGGDLSRVMAKPPESVLSFRRTGREEEVLVLLNFGGKAVEAALPDSVAGKRGWRELAAAGGTGGRSEAVVDLTAGVPLSADGYRIFARPAAGR